MISLGGLFDQGESDGYTLFKTPCPGLHAAFDLVVFAVST